MLVGLLAGAALLSAAPATAQAPPIPDITPTNPAQSPWDAVRSGGYSNTSYDALAKRLGYKLDSQLAANSGLTQTQRRYAQSRLQTAASRGRLLPALRTAAPFLRFGVGAGAVALTGVIAYEIITTRNGETFTQHYELERASLGGAEVWTPGCITKPCGDSGGLGTFWRVVPDTGADGKFGWKYVTLATVGGAWIFQYSMEYAWGDKPPPDPCSTLCYPQWGVGQNQIGPQPANGIPVPVAGGANGRFTDPQISAAGYALPFPESVLGERASLVQAAVRTVEDLEGNLTPLIVEADADATAPGHTRAGLNCKITTATAGGACFLPYVREYEMEKHAPREVKEGPAASPEKTTNYAAPDTATPGDWTNITDELNDNCGRQLFNHLAEPSKYAYGGCVEGEDPNSPPELAPATFTLPKPLPNETAPAYITRLRQLGYMGTVTQITLDVPLEGYGPGTPVRIVLPQPTPARVFDPIQWPLPAPVVETDTPITIRINPPTAIEIPTNPGQPPAPPLPPPPPGAPGDTTGPGCSCPSNGLDLGPLTGQNYGSSFPFGVFTMVAGILAAFNVAPDAPSWTFNLSNAHLTNGDYAIDLQAFDPYMSIIRTLISWVLWIGALWWFGTRLLGFNTGGDPQEAADEALP